ncbi:MGDG synthase family glycosyltransferase [Anaerospora hongkongensis]|uniref:MGDG synthase family glycosyltransferase n=1 Tax=Anaerospora hongkongensis TaxID=244830 RepID=UPI00289E5295|nr:glycosyltransferase [Anaerospora hongkongensis]
MLSCVNHVLIVSASIGSGHTQAANAVKAELERQHPDIRVAVVDFLEGDNFSLNTFIKETYLKMIDVFPDMYDLLYRWSQASHNGTTVRNLMSWILKKRILRLIDRYRPDLIVFTHPFPCGAACHLKRKEMLTIPLAGVITDYAVHRLWLYNEVDSYFVAVPDLKENLIQQGIAAEKIHITGIPISSSFGEVGAAPRTVKANDGPATILIMGGGQGLGAVVEVLTELDKIEGQYRFVVVAGRNAGLRKDLQLLSRSLRHPVQVIGYTRRIPELMADADLLVTKPGALTCSEALAAGLPMVLVNAIPGQEEENARHLAQNGAAIWAEEKSQLNRTVQQLLANPLLLQAMREQAQRMGRPDAARQIVRQLIGNRKTTVIRKRRG